MRAKMANNNTPPPMPPAPMDLTKLMREQQQQHQQRAKPSIKSMTFDPLVKLYYLDEMETMEDRWDVFFARFQLMGQ